MTVTAVKPRKLPVQNRSRKRVETIQDVTATLLLENGFESLTAVGIAEKAGIPVASLYQYYPNKEAIIYSLCETMISTVITRFDDYEKFDDHGMDIWELLAVIGEKEYANPSRHKLEFELNRAMTALPQLSELQAGFDENLSKHYANILRHYGSSWTEKELVNLARIMFRIGNTYFAHINATETDPVLAEQSKALVLRAICSLVEASLSGPPFRLKQ